jgi:hypothetical protein
MGERHHLVKLSEKQIRKIISRYAAGGITQEMLGAQFGVTQAMISCIVLRKNWTHMDIKV